MSQKRQKAQRSLRSGQRFRSRSLGEIAAAAERIAASGRPQGRLPQHRNDEFGRLSIAFNTMIDRLAASYADLENRVAERTRDAEESRQRAEKAARLLQEAVSSIAQGFTIYDDDDRLVVCNEAYLRLYETSRDLIVPGASFEEIVRRGAERGQYKAAVGHVDAWVRQRVAQHRSACGEVIEQQLDDGRWLMIVEYRTPSGYIVGNRIDISERKRIEQALAASEQRWELAMGGANDGIWDWNVQTGQLYLSERWKTMLGFAAADFTGRIEEWQGLLHEEDRPRVMAALKCHLAGETEFYESEFRLRCRDGGYKWILSRGKAGFDAEGKAVRMSGSHTDVTQRHAAESRIREHSEQLKSIFALSPDGFVSFDGALRVSYASPAFTRLTGLQQSEVMGLDEVAFSARLAAICLATAPFSGIAALRAMQRMPRGTMRKDDADGTVIDRRQKIELAGAGKRVLQVGLRESQAETVAQILYLRDITHETEVDRLKSEFLSTAAHELRTPMASIYGFSELLLAQEFDVAEQRDFLNTIFKQSALMVSIINELLDLARIEARRGKDFSIGRIDVRALLREIVADFKRPDRRPAPIQPSTRAPLWVRGDCKKLTQALSNVLSNAYKYSPGGGAVDIDFVLPKAGKRQGAASAVALLGIRITDHGIGMTPQQLSRVCERFYRADSSGKIPGTGLGMSIVKEIVQLHGGEVTLDSRFGSGTAVTIWLPADTPEPTA